MGSSRDGAIFSGNQCLGETGQVKTFVRLQHDVFGTSLTTLMHVLNHLSERQTLSYMGLLAEDVAEAYAHAI